MNTRYLVLGIFASIVSMFSVLQPCSVEAASLTQSQINTVSGMLQSWGVSPSIVSRVQVDLYTGGNFPGASLTNNQTISITNLLQTFGADQATINRVQTDLGIPNTTEGVQTNTHAGPKINISASMTPVAQVIAAGPSVTLANIQLDVSQSGENVVFNGIKLFEVGSGQTSALSSCQLYDNSSSNNAVGSASGSIPNDNPTIPDGNDSRAAIFYFSKPFIVPKGTITTLAVKCNIASNASGTYGFGVYNSTTAYPLAHGAITMDLLTSDNITITTGRSGLQTIVASSQTPTASSTQSNQAQTIGYVFASRSAYDPTSNQVKSIGSTAVHFTGIRFTSGSTEDVKLIGIKWHQTGTALQNDLSNVVTVINGTQYPTIFDSAGKYYITSPTSGITIPKNSSADVYIQGDITGSNSASHTVIMNIGSTADVQLIGSTFNDKVSFTRIDTLNSYTTTIVAPGTQTAAPGTLSVSVDSSSPSRTIVPAGTNNVLVGILKLHAAGENITLNKLGLQLTNSGNTKSSGSGSSTNGGINDVTQVYIYKDATLLGTATFTESSLSAISTLTTPITVNKNTDVLLTIKADLANVGVAAQGGIGDIIKIDPLNAQSVGVSSGTIINSNVGNSINSVTTGVSGIQMFKSYPTFNNTGVTCTSSNSCNGMAQTIKKFTITANSAGSIGINKINISIATSSADIKNVRLLTYTNSNYSTQANTGIIDGQFGTSYTTVFSRVLSFSNINPLNTVQQLELPAGQTYYFAIVGDVIPSPVANNWYVNATVLGDASPAPTVSGRNTNTAAALSSYGSNFIWSDNATTTSGNSEVDWTNGYYIPGLPVLGL